MVQVVTAEVEKFEVFGQHKMFWLEMFYFIVGQIHPHYVRWQVRWDANQICRQKKFRNIRPSTFMIPERQKFLLSSVHTKKRYVNRGCEHFRLFNSDRNVSASLWLQDGLQVVCNFLHFQDVVKGDIMYDNISLICQRALFCLHWKHHSHTLILVFEVSNALNSQSILRIAISITEPLWSFELKSHTGGRFYKCSSCRDGGGEIKI